MSKRKISIAIQPYLYDLVHQQSGTSFSDRLERLLLRALDLEKESPAQASETSKLAETRFGFFKRLLLKFHNCLSRCFSNTLDSKIKIANHRTHIMKFWSKP